MRPVLSSGGRIAAGKTPDLHSHLTTCTGGDRTIGGSPGLGSVLCSGHLLVFRRRLFGALGFEPLGVRIPAIA